MLFTGALQLTVVVLIPGPKMVTSILLQFMFEGVAEAQFVPLLNGLVDVVNVPLYVMVDGVPTKGAGTFMVK